MPTVHVAVEDALLVASGSGPTSDDWTLEERLVDHRPECVACSRTAQHRVLCGTFDAGLHRSSDGGVTWDRVGEETLPDSVMSLTVSPHDPDEWWAGTEPSRVYRSTDGGETWTARSDLTELPSADEWYFPPRPHTHHVRWIEIDPHHPRRLYVGIEAGAFVWSDDAGETWHERPPGSRFDNHQLATHPDAPGRVYAAAGDGYAESTDAGVSWSHPQTGLDRRYVWSVAPTPADPDVVLVSAARGAGAAHSLPAESYVYRRRDGEDWTRLDGRGLPSGEGAIRAVLAPGADDAEVYAANNHGLFHTTDAGEAWSPLSVSWPERASSMTVRGLGVVP